jgi:hypothetical protein
MATLAVTQPTGEGISLKFAYTPNGAADAATGTVFLATTSVTDELEFIYRDFVYTSNEATIVLTTAELTRIYGTAKVSSGDYTATLTMSATAVAANSAVLKTATTIGGAAAGAGVLTFQAVPTAPVITSLSAQDGYIQIAFTTVSAIALTLSDSKAVCDIIVNSIEDGIQTFTGLTSIALSNNGTTYSVTVATGADSLVNGQSYEAAVRTSNINGNSLFSDTDTIVPNNLPNALGGVQVNTAYASGTTLHGTNAATMTATWLDADATTGDSVLVRFGVVSGGAFNADNSTQQSTLAIATPADFTASATAVGDLPIPNAWFETAQNGSDVTELEIVARIEQTTGATTTSSALTAATTVYKITLPTLSAITIESVSSVGLQTFNTSTGGTAVDDIGTAATLTATYNGADTNIPITIASNLTATMDDNFTMDYATVDAGSNGDLVFTLSLPDANGTQQSGSTVNYTVSSTQSLHAFKDPAVPTVTITGGLVTAAPTIEVTSDNANNGYTAATYNAVVFDNADANYKTYIATYAQGAGSVTATGETGIGSSAYVVANYHVSFTKVLTGIPSDYDGKYTSPTVTGTSTVLALYFINPTITNVAIAGADMIITGNTGGANFSAGAITSLGFTAGSSDNDFDISTETATMVLSTPGATGNLAAYAFAVTVTHTQGALVLNRNNAATGGAFDGFGFVNASNANSALSILNA